MAGATLEPSELFLLLLTPSSAYRNSRPATVGFCQHMQTRLNPFWPNPTQKKA